MRRALSFTAAFSGVVAIITACGSASPLSDTLPSTNDGGAPIEPIDASIETPVADATTLEAGPLACAGCVVTTCGQQIQACLADTGCVGILECVTTTCLNTGTKVVTIEDAGASDVDGGDAGDAGDAGKTTTTTTTGGGGLDTSCLLGCLTKTPSGALDVFAIFTCVSGTCGGDCGSVLGGLGGGGLGGLGGLGGFGKAPIDEGALNAGTYAPAPLGPIDEASFREVFAPVVDRAHR